MNKLPLKFLLSLLVALGTSSSTLLCTPWHWYITHLRLSNNTKHLECSVVEFDSVVRVYDNDTYELILTLQRIDLDRNTVPFQKNQMRFEFSEHAGGQHWTIHDGAVPLLDILVGTGSNCLRCLKADGSPAEVFHVDYSFQQTGSRALVVAGGLMRVYPYSLIAPDPDGTYKETFAGFRKN